MMPERLSKRPLTSEYSVQLGFSFPRRVGRNLEIWRNAVLNQDADCVIIVDGDEGLAGKSHTAAQIAYLMDIDKYEETGEFDEVTKKPIYRPVARRFEIDQFAFNKAQCIKKIREMPKFRAIVYDEAGRSTDRRKSSSAENLDFNQFMREARQYNKFLILVMQSFYDGDMQMSVRRSRVLINMSYLFDLDKPLNPLVRGPGRFYNHNGKKLLYTNKALRGNFQYPLIKNESFDCKFSYHWVVDHDEYKKVKHDAEMERDTKTDVCSGCGSAELRFKKKEGIQYCRRCGTERPVVGGGAGASLPT